MIASRGRRFAIAFGLILTCAHCGKDGGATSPTPTTPPDQLPPGSSGPGPGPAAPEILAGAGDIGWCGSPAPDQTARLLENLGAQIFTTGDNAYFSGTEKEFRDCYDPTWGRFKSRTRPVPGNHEYETPGAVPYFNYFGGFAGTPGAGYYSYDMVQGNWHIIALNSIYTAIPVNSGSLQAQWLQADLAQNRSKCTLAYWHYPLFTSGPNGAQTQMRDFWRILYDANADIIVNSHDHLYERFAPQDPDGRPDPARGMREFVVGTGGAHLYDFRGVTPNSERQIKQYGVIKFTLHADSYQWEFIPVSGAGDSGTGTCH